jgi:hypothetical protein
MDIFSIYAIIAGSVFISLVLLNLTISGAIFQYNFDPDC